MEWDNQRSDWLINKIKKGEMLSSVEGMDFTRNDPSSSRPDKLEIQFSIDGIKQEKLKFNNEASKND